MIAGIGGREMEAVVTAGGRGITGSTEDGGMVRMGTGGIRMGLRVSRRDEDIERGESTRKRRLGGDRRSFRRLEPISFLSPGAFIT
jgi:hypothetical protein